MPTWSSAASRSRSRRDAGAGERERVPDELQRDRALVGAVGAAGAVDAPHAALADERLDAVRPDADPHVGVVLGQRPEGRLGMIEQRVVAQRVGEKPTEAPACPGVERGHVRVAGGAVQPQRAVERRVECRPAVVGRVVRHGSGRQRATHQDIKARRYALALFQSRAAVRAEVPRTSATSATSIPP